jgi:hypothetical protein
MRRVNNAIGQREFVPTEVNYDTRMVAMRDSLLAASTIAGSGAARLDALLNDSVPTQSESFAGIDDFERVSLVYVRSGTLKAASAWDPDSADAIVELRQVHLYFEEVGTGPLISEQDMRERLMFARSTGFLLLGPDECIAVLRRRDGLDYTFCDVFENNDQGVLRNLGGYHFSGLESRAAAKRIATLDSTDTDRYLCSALGDCMWWLREGMPISALQAERLRNTVKLLRQHKLVAPVERLASGARCIRSFIRDGSTASTQALRPYSEGWRHYPTSGDAHYFGIWVNPVKRETLCYCEQDVTHVMCDDDAQFRAEMLNLAQQYAASRSPSLYAIGDCGTTACFDSLTFLQGNVKTLNLSGSDALKDSDDRLIAPLFGHLKLDSAAVTTIANGEQIELKASEFELDLLDTRAYGAHLAFLNRAFDRLQVLVRIDGEAVEFSCFVDN